MVEGNKQAKILESEAEKQLLIILNIYRQPPSVWRREVLESEAEKQQLIISYIYRQPASVWQRETSRPRSWSLRQRSNS